MYLIFILYSALQLLLTNVFTPTARGSSKARPTTCGYSQLNWRVIYHNLDNIFALFSSKKNKCKENTDPRPARHPIRTWRPGRRTICEWRRRDSAKRWGPANVRERARSCRDPRRAPSIPCSRPRFRSIPTAPGTGWPAPDRRSPAQNNRQSSHACGR